jgi:hypothetical protein
MLDILTTSHGFADRLPVFATEEFLAAKSVEHGWFVSQDFALPFFVDQRLCFRRLIFTTETVPLTANATVEAETAFLDAVMELCDKRQKISVDFVSTAQANSVFRTVPAGSDHIPWGSYVVDLGQTEAVIFSRFHSKHRNTIRNAESNGVSVTATSDTRVVYELLKQTMTRQNLLFYPSVSYLDALQRNLKEHVTFYIARHGEEVQCAAVVVQNRLGGFYYYGGSAKRPATGSSNLMQFEIMKDLRRKKVLVYDLMGARMDTGGDAKIEGIQRFKERFASGMRKGFCFRYVVRPARHRLFTFCVKSYFLMKGSRYAGDVIDQASQIPIAARPLTASESGTTG